VIKNIELIIEEESQGWDVPAEQGGLVHIPGATQKEPTNLLVKGYSVSKLPLKLQKQLTDNGYKIATIDMYSFPEEAFVSKKDPLIALPEANVEKGVHIVGWDGLELISETTFQSMATTLLFRVDASSLKFFVMYESAGEYYCLMGHSQVENNEVEKHFCSCHSCSCGSKIPEVAKTSNIDIQFYFSIKENPNPKPNAPNCDLYHVIITPVDQWHREGYAADQLEGDEHVAFLKLEKALKDLYGIEFSEDTELCFSAYPKPGVDAATMRTALLDIGFQTCDAFDRFIQEHD
jgi:hypothetical protein